MIFAAVMALKAYSMYKGRLVEEVKSGTERLRKGEAHRVSENLVRDRNMTRHDHTNLIKSSLVREDGNVPVIGRAVY
jgi:hypothetical protein